MLATAYDIWAAAIPELFQRDGDFNAIGRLGCVQSDVRATHGCEWMMVNEYNGAISICVLSRFRK
jgi:hypothetical protein